MDPLQQGRKEDEGEDDTHLLQQQTIEQSKDTHARRIKICELLRKNFEIEEAPTMVEEGKNTFTQRPMTLYKFEGEKHKDIKEKLTRPNALSVW